MSWFRREPNETAETDNDPRIELVRQALKSGRAKRGRDGEHATRTPRGIDCDFCYGEDSGSCA